VINSLPRTTAHNAPINKIKTPKFQIVTRENLVPSYSPNEEGNKLMGLNFPNTFPRKDNGRRTLQLIIKRTDSKSPLGFNFHLIRSQICVEGNIGSQDMK